MFILSTSLEFLGLNNTEDPCSKPQVETGENLKKRILPSHWWITEASLKFKCQNDFDWSKKAKSKKQKIFLYRKGPSVDHEIKLLLLLLLFSQRREHKIIVFVIIILKYRALKRHICHRYFGKEVPVAAGTDEYYKHYDE